MPNEIIEIYERNCPRKTNLLGEMTSATDNQDAFGLLANDTELTGPSSRAHPIRLVLYLMRYLETDKFIFIDHVQAEKFLGFDVEYYFRRLERKGILIRGPEIQTYDAQGYSFKFNPNYGKGTVAEVVSMHNFKRK